MVPGNSTDKIRLMLAGQDSQSTIYNMNPIFTHDARYQVMGVVSDWEDFKKQIPLLKPELLVIHTAISPKLNLLLEEFAKMDQWGGIILAVLPQSDWHNHGSLEKMGNLRGCFVDPVNWADVANRGFNTVMTERARNSVSIAGQERARKGSSLPQNVTGTRTVAVIPVSGGAGASTIAGNLTYELQTRFHIQSLLMGFDHPAAVVPHFGLHYRPDATEFFIRPSEGFSSAIQQTEGMDIIVAPENSIEYAKAQNQTFDKSSTHSIYSLIMEAWGRQYAGIILDLPSDENAWLLQGVAAANTILLVARPTLQDISATWQKLKLLEEKLVLQHRIPRENIFLVINQASEFSSFSAHEFFLELSALHHWAPPVTAIIPYDPKISREQDRSNPPILVVDELRKGIHAIADVLFPGMIKNQIENTPKQGLFSKFPFRISVR